MAMQNSFDRVTLEMLLQVLKFLFIQTDFHINNKSHAEVLCTFKLNDQGGLFAFNCLPFIQQQCVYWTLFLLFLRGLILIFFVRLDC